MSASGSWSAEEVAAALDLGYTPTEEQRRVIEAPLESQLVVAGAGSGKTETMAARVVWLVANGLVEPDAVLGLTFTRKAASELSERIVTRLARLRASGLWTPVEGEGAALFGGSPTVSTYHAYAARLVREHGVLLGVESELRMLSEASAWQLAHEAVVRYDGPMAEVTLAEHSITSTVVDLAQEMSEHLVGVSEVDELLAAVSARWAGLPPAEGSRLRSHPGGLILDRIAERRLLLPMVEEFRRLKRSRDSVDFGDIMEIAARLAAGFPAIGDIERSRFAVVLLDEFQDTSEAQMLMLRNLFVGGGGTGLGAGSGTDPLSVPVTAVGDPHQSIYGWRGASATTLSRFPEEFGEGETAARVLALATSWRNDTAVLDVANVLAAPLRAAARVAVAELAARPTAGVGEVFVGRALTQSEEATMVVDWLVRQRRRAEGSSAAILCRKRSQFDPLIAALEAADVPFTVVGLGGLLLTPEVEDIVALLGVVDDATRGDHLMRLLTGPLVRLGAADLDALGAWARALSRRDVDPGADPGVDIGADPGVDRAGTREAEPGTGEAGAGTGEAGAGTGEAGSGPDRARESSGQVSIVEAIDRLPPPAWEGRDGETFSATAHERLRDLADLVEAMRRLTGLPLADLVAEAERALGLDIEVLARPGYTPAAARAHLDAFADVAAQFSVSADRPTLGGFLAWIDAAVREERGLDRGYVEASPDAVHLMTVHSAKGLEWDLVAVPGLVEGTFPAHAMTASPASGEWRVNEPSDPGWLGSVTQSGIPFELRGDRDGLPDVGWRTVADWDDLARALATFGEAGGARHLEEERRLAYVAATRARSALLLTAHVWGSGATPRQTSRFLTEVVEAAEAGMCRVRRGPWADMPPADRALATRPESPDTEIVSWPVDDHAERRARLTGPAEALSCALMPPDPEAGDRGSRTAPAPWQGELDALLAEHREAAHQRERPRLTLTLPEHLSTSELLDLARDPDRFAVDLRRPVPEAPSRSARRGTAFHAWVEQHYAAAAIVDVLDLPGHADEDRPDDEEFAALRAHFLASEWADLTPLDVEISLETTLDGVALRGRVDAVFADPDPARSGGFVLVDWKTGPRPHGQQAELRALQLAAYRLAWARLRAVDPARVRGAFFYARTGETVWPELPGEEAILGVLRAVPVGP